MVMRFGRWRLGPWALAGLVPLLVLGLLAYVYLRPPPVPRFVLDGHSYIELSSATKKDILIVLYSGDGGWWGDVDRKIAEWFAARGYAVVGVDTNIYFHDGLAPERVAGDLDNLILDLSDRWHTPKVALIGYSFGADILPMAYNRISKRAQRRVIFMGLLALGKTSPLKVTIAEQAGIDTAGPAVEPELAKLPVKLLICIDGREEEKDSGCHLPPLRKAEVLITDGGHHFDHQYELLEKTLSEGIKRRSRVWPFRSLGWGTKTPK